MAEDFSKDATVRELVRNEKKAIRDSFTGVLKAVVPDVTRGLAKVARGFRDTLIKGVDEDIQTSYNQLQKFLSTFDVEIGSLGKSFLDVEKAFKGLTKQNEKVNQDIEKLKEKNIAAEKQIYIDQKTNQIEMRAVLLTDEKLIDKRKKILEEEKKKQDELKENTKKIREYQKKGEKATNKQGVNLLKQRENIELDLFRLQEEKKLYEGKGGRFDTRIGGFLDNFENTINDKAPDFLVAFLTPLINTARQIQKTITVLIDTFNFLKDGLLKILPDIRGFLTPVFETFKKGLKSVGKGIESTITFFGKGLHTAVDSLGSGLLKASKGIQKSFLTVSEGFTSLFSGFGKSIGKVVGILATFGKRIILTGITMLAAIVAPLLPVLIPLLKFAAIVTGVVVAITLLKKGFDALTDWFKNSWLGKKIFGGDKGKEPEKEKTLASKDLNRMSMDETNLPEEPQSPVKKEKEKPKVITEKPLMPEPKPKSDVEKLYEEKANLDDMIQQSKDKSNTFGQESMAELQRFKETGKTDEGLTGSEAEEYFAKKAAAHKKFRERIIAQEKENQIAFDNELKKMGFSKEEADKLVADSKKADFEKPEIQKKEITPDVTTGQGQVVINNVTAPQNVASTSTQQVVAANAAKSNDDTFLNLNRHV